MSHSVSLFSEVQLEALEPEPYKRFPIPHSLAQSAISDQTKIRSLCDYPLNQARR